VDTGVLRRRIGKTEGGTASLIDVPWLFCERTQAPATRASTVGPASISDFSVVIPIQTDVKLHT
jgi:hypothetical protein